MLTWSLCLGLKHIRLWIFRAPLRDCEAVTLTHKLSCRGSLFVTQISQLTWEFRMRRVWRDIADMNPLESDNSLVTYHSWFACPLIDLQADSRTRLRNGDAPRMPPRYLHLDLPKHVMRNVSRFHLQAHTLAVESSIWRGGNGHRDVMPDHCYWWITNLTYTHTTPLIHGRYWLTRKIDVIIISYWEAGLSVGLTFPSSPKAQKPCDRGHATA